LNGCEYGGTGFIDIVSCLAGHVTVQNQPERNPAPTADTKDVIVMVIAKILMLPK
jgi:hypothetical protein